MPRSDVPACPEKAISLRLMDLDFDSASNSPDMPVARLKHYDFSVDQKRACFKLVSVVGEHHLFFGGRSELFDPITRNRIIGAINHVENELPVLTNCFKESLGLIRGRGEITDDSLQDVVCGRINMAIKCRLKIHAMDLTIHLSRVNYDKTDCMRLRQHSERLDTADKMMSKDMFQMLRIFPTQLVRRWKDGVVKDYRPFLSRLWCTDTKLLARVAKAQSGVVMAHNSTA